MSQQNKQIRLWPAVIIFAIILAAVVSWTGCKKQPAEQPDTEHASNDQSPSESPAESTDEPTKTNTKPVAAEPAAAEPVASAKVGLNDIIKAARRWGPAYQSWYGKPAPDFTLTDITGKQHKLSDYRGKDVIIVLWATWCGPCIMEIPHLVELQNTVGEDKLAILGISYISPRNTAEMVKDFVEQTKIINYSVFSPETGSVPTPFDNRAGYIPCSFFIDSEGKIKLATIGLLSLPEMKAILQAE